MKIDKFTDAQTESVFNANQALINNFNLKYNKKYEKIDDKKSRIIE